MSVKGKDLVVKDLYKDPTLARVVKLEGSKNYGVEFVGVNLEQITKVCELLNIE